MGVAACNAGVGAVSGSDGRLGIGAVGVILLSRKLYNIAWVAELIYGTFTGFITTLFSIQPLSICLASAQMIAPVVLH